MSTISLSVVSELLNSRTGGSGIPPLLYMTDETRVPNPLPEIMKLKAGSGVIVRHYLFGNKIALAKAIQLVCRERRLLFLVGGDFELARKLDADGIHLPDHSLKTPTLAIRAWQQRPNKLVTAAVHSARSLLKCDALGVDAALISPVFTTKSHTETENNKKTLGILGLIKMSRLCRVPVYALGGITNKNAIQLLKSRVIGIAGIGIVGNAGENHEKNRTAGRGRCSRTPNLPQKTT
jgi:thiamine-phosphate pyrophosphorylase